MRAYVCEYVCVHAGTCSRERARVCVCVNIHELSTHSVLKKHRTT